MTFPIFFVLAIIILAYAAAQVLKRPVEISMLVAAVAGGLAGAFFKTPQLIELPRHLVEGAFTYLDVILVFSTATIFMAIVSESGGVNYVVRGATRTLGRFRVLALIVLMIIVLIPGALTGAGSVSILVVGAPVAMALLSMGISRKRTAAILFITAGLSAAAPPVNIWAMVLCAGTAIPYVGFELTLGIPVLLLGTFTVLVLGLKRDKKAEAITFPEVSAGMAWWRVAIPFIVFFGLIVAYRLWPFNLPLLGLPLEFTISGLIAWLLSPKRINIWRLSGRTLKRLLPLLSIMIIVGMLQQVMTITGVRGLISYAVISIPLILLFISFAVIIPFSEGILAYGAAAILGIPLIWYLNSIGLHATVAIAGLSMLWPLGDALPPTAIIARLSIMVSEYKGSLWSVIRTMWLPWLVQTAAGILMIVFSAKLSFLVRWSM
jgi:CitMHS family citrate-Mg2+:H+ or citrate-Ca2+:H+ symporter